MGASRKSFSLYTKTRKSFNIVMSYFDYTISFIFNITNRIRISFASSAIVRSVSNINLKRIRIVISQVKLITSMLQTINLKRVRIVATARERGRLIVSIIQRLNITFVSKALQRLATTIILKKIKFTFTAILATFYTLAYHDPSTLATMDVETLEDLDYLLS